MKRVTVEFKYDEDADAFSRTVKEWGEAPVYRDFDVWNTGPAQIVEDES